MRSTTLKLHMKRGEALAYLRKRYKKQGRIWVEHKAEEYNDPYCAVLWSDGGLWWTFEGNREECLRRMAVTQQLRTEARIDGE